MPNPFSDFWDFVIGNTEDYNDPRLVEVSLSCTVFGAHHREHRDRDQKLAEDPSQRTARISARVRSRARGGMWFKKCVEAAAAGLGRPEYWTEKMGERAAFAFIASW